MNFKNNIFFIILLIFSCSEKSQIESILSVINSNTDIKAEIIKVNSNDDFLFEGKYFLKISNNTDSLAYILNFDLLQNQGGYESAIVDIKWLSDSTLFIERYLYDRKQNMIYNLNSVSLINIKDSIPSILNGTVKDVSKIAK